MPLLPQEPSVGDGAKKWFASWKSWLPQEPGVYFETNGWCMQSLNMISQAFTVSAIYIQSRIDAALLTKADSACRHVHHHALMGITTMECRMICVSLPDCDDTP